MALFPSEIPEDSTETMVEELFELAKKSGFTIRQCSGSHYQVIVSTTGKPLVNVWPTSQKFMAVQWQPGLRAKTGMPAEIIQLARQLLEKGA